MHFDELGWKWGRTLMDLDLPGLGLV